MFPDPRHSSPMPTLRAWPGALTLALLLAAPLAHAQFVAVETKDVPVERVLKNLERQRTETPHPGLLLELARVHALASTRPTIPVQVTPQFPDDYVWPWWGYVQTPLPWTQFSPPVADLAPDQGPHIVAAIALYRELLALQPDDLLVKLGLGWCLLRSGDRAGAVPLLRDAAEGTWAREREWDHAGMGGSQAQEAAGYLAQALDPVADAAEIESLRARIKTISKRPRPVTPLLVGLEDRPLETLVHADARVPFDLDGSGLTRPWPWPGEDAAWLVWDPTGAGEIRSGLQLFGSVTWWIFWEDGFRPLRALDDDGDGRLAGGELDGLALWRDADTDGRSDPGEVLPLARYGIVSLGTAATVGPDGVLTAVEGARTADGRVLPVWDWVPRSGNVP